MKPTDYRVLRMSADIQSITWTSSILIESIVVSSAASKCSF